MNLLNSYPEFFDDAACRHLTFFDIDRLFFAGSDHPGKHAAHLDREAKRICHTCPVIHECLEYALHLDIPHGVFGGLTEYERRRLRTRNQTSATPLRYRPPRSPIKVVHNRSQRPQTTPQEA